MEARTRQKVRRQTSQSVRVRLGEMFFESITYTWSQALLVQGQLSPRFLDRFEILDRVTSNILFTLSLSISIRFREVDLTRVSLSLFVDLSGQDSCGIKTSLLSKNPFGGAIPSGAHLETRSLYGLLISFFSMICHRGFDFSLSDGDSMVEGR
ncbi:hypothetical protein Tco_0735856 [Tanacetum coccineum]